MHWIAREAMDLYNNSIGLRIAKANPLVSKRRLEALVMQTLRGGDLVVVGQDGHFDWSERIGHNQNGVAVPGIVRGRHVGQNRSAEPRY
jgi:hypothetical protein